MNWFNIWIWKLLRKLSICYILSSSYLIWQKIFRWTIYRKIRLVQLLNMHHMLILLIDFNLFIIEVQYVLNFVFFDSSLEFQFLFSVENSSFHLNDKRIIWIWTNFQFKFNFTLRLINDMKSNKRINCVIEHFFEIIKIDLLAFYQVTKIFELIRWIIYRKLRLVLLLSMHHMMILLIDFNFFIIEVYCN